MGDFELLYSYYLKEKALRKELEQLNDDIKILEFKQRHEAIEDNLDQLNEALESLIENVSKVNDEKVTIQMQTNKSSTNENIVKLSLEHHEDFLQLLTNIHKFKEIIELPAIQVDNTRREIGHAVTKIQNDFAELEQRSFDNINNFLSCEGLYENTNRLQETSMDETNDSDLGCCLLDASLRSIKSPDSKFAMSSPISMIEKHSL